VKESEREREKFFERNSFFSCMLFYHFETFQKSALRFGPGLLFGRSAFLFFSFIESRKLEKSLLATTTTASDEFCEKFFVKVDAGKKKKKKNQSFRAFELSSFLKITCIMLF
jgi:hypothetical protein